jgi:hypothetical protein
MAVIGECQITGENARNLSGQDAAGLALLATAALHHGKRLG